MDFIVGLPVVQGCDAILVVVDRLTKLAHFIPCSSTVTASDTSQLILNHIIKLHGLPDDIVSDRGPVFIAAFWKALFTQLGVQHNKSSAFHPQSDGQTERVNQVLEQYLRCYISYQQDDWIQHLPLAEFTYNNTHHDSTKTSPFLATYGYNPRFSLQPNPSSAVPDTTTRIQLLADQHSLLQHELRAAQEQHKNTADRSRLQPPPLAVGDKVWLLRRHIKTKRPCSSLDYKKLGPFPISAIINPVSYKLSLPPQCKIHPVFHVSLLEPYVDSTFPDRLQPVPPPVEVDQHIEYEVEAILDSRLHRQQLQYLVQWKGYPVEEATWEPTVHVANCSTLVQSFHDRYPSKPGPKPA
jgi:transposase InsO family protein